MDAGHLFAEVCI